jgi:hypothetical protein
VIFGKALVDVPIGILIEGANHALQFAVKEDHDREHASQVALTQDVALKDSEEDNEATDGGKKIGLKKSMASSMPPTVKSLTKAMKVVKAVKAMKVAGDTAKRASLS